MRAPYKRAMQVGKGEPSTKDPPSIKINKLIRINEWNKKLEEVKIGMFEIPMFELVVLHFKTTTNFRIIIFN